MAKVTEILPNSLTKENFIEQLDIMLSNKLNA